jgi:hypothetical protein
MRAPLAVAILTIVGFLSWRMRHFRPLVDYCLHSQASRASAEFALIVRSNVMRPSDSILTQFNSCMRKSAQSIIRRKYLLSVEFVCIVFWSHEIQSTDDWAIRYSHWA